MFTTTETSEFIDQMIKFDRKMNLNVFLENFSTKFYPESNFDFMEKFLEWSLVENKNKFIIPHEMLYEYGVTIDIQSQNIKKRIEALELIKDVDFTLRKFYERGSSGSQVHHRYWFTPYAFKLLLMSATKHKKHTVDVSTYRKYYLFLEEAVAYYRQYQFEVVNREKNFTNNKFRFVDRQWSTSMNEVSKLRVEMKQRDEEARKRDEEQRAQIAELREYAIENKEKAIKNEQIAIETKETLNEMQEDLTEIKEEVKIAKSYLVEKSLTSTRNPTNENKHHYFAATTYFNQDQNQFVKFVSGQKSYVLNTIDKYVNDRNHQIIINPFFNANGIDLRQNVHEEFVKRRAERVKKINESNVIKDRDYNSKLQIEIRKHNKVNPNNKRVYSDEKRKSVVVKTKDILVNFTKLSFKYTNNPYIGFDEVLQIIIDVNDITQESPLPSDEE